MLPRGHRTQLDGLRAIAVMMVAAFHWHHLEAFGVVLPLGFLGVGLFFVLSGYLITGILLGVSDRARTIGASRFSATKSFAVRRMLRLLPALFLYIIVISVFEFHGDPAGWAWHFFYLSNFRFYSLGHWPVGVAHLWSLAVEEQFYIVAPFTTLFLSRPTLKKVAIGLIAFIAVSNYFVGAARLLPPWAFLGLLAGCWLALEAYDGNVDGSWPKIDAFASRWPYLWLGYVAIWTLETAIALPRFVYETNYLLAHLAMAAVVWRGVTGFSGLAGACLNSRLMQSIGRVSYGAYLWHFFAAELQVRHLPIIDDLPLPVRFVVLFAITIALAQLSYHVCEKWFIALKDRFPYLPETNDEVEPPQDEALPREASLLNS